MDYQNKTLETNISSPSFNSIFKRTSVFLAASALVFGGFFVANSASAATINVPVDQPTIQDAIDAATSGDTINVATGIYPESITVDETLSIVGAGNTTVISPAVDSDGIAITADGVTIQDLKVETSNSGVTPNKAISVEEADDLEINTVTIETTGNKAMGIWVGGSNNGLTPVSRLTIIGSTVTVGNSATALYADHSTPAHSNWTIGGSLVNANTFIAELGNPVELYDVTTSEVSYNTITTSASGGSAFIWSSELSNISNLTFANNSVNYSGGSQVAFITDFPVEDATDTTISTITITGNTFSNWGSRALRIGDGDGSDVGTVTGVAITSNTFNMSVDSEVIGGTDAGSATGAGNTFNVQEPAGIQDAIDSAFSGDTVNVATGTYAAVTLNKSLTLQGPNVGISPNTGSRVAEAVITGSAPLVRLPSGANVNPLIIEGFAFEDATVGVGRPDVILADGVSDGWGNVTIRSNRFINNYGPAVGVYATGGSVDSGWTITDNLIDGVTGYQKSGIYLVLDTLLAGWEISNNTIRYTEYGGIMVHGVLQGAVDVVISENTIEDVQKTGIQSSGIYGNLTITDNVITRANLDHPEEYNPDDARAGIRLYVTDPDDEYGPSELIGPVWVTNNIVTDSYIGFAIKDSHDITGKVVHVNGNTFTGNIEAGLRHGGTGLLDATNNWWGKASGPSDNGVGDGDAVFGDVNYRPWLLEAGGDTYDQTIALTEAGQWALVSAPTLLSEEPAIVDDGGEAEVVLAYENGAWAIPGVENTKPASAFYIKTTTKGGIGFKYYTGDPTQVSKQLTEGWNLVGTNSNGTPVNEFSTIINTNDPDNEGVITLNVPKTYNDRKDVGGVWDGAIGNIDISNWPTNVLNPYDGYWVYTNADKTYSLIQ